MTRIYADKNQIKIREYLCHPRSILFSFVLTCLGFEVNSLSNRTMNKKEY